MKLNLLFNLIKNPEIYKFLIVGIGAAFSMEILSILFTSVFGIFYVISIALAFEITLLWGFFAHDKWTFSKVQKNSKTINRFIKYNIFSLIALGINESILVFFTSYVGLQYYISEGISIISTFFFNYLVNKRISFKN